MTIAANRFKNLDNQFNIGITNFLSAADDAILNIPDINVNVITPELADFINKSLQTPVVKPSSIADSTVRAAKNALGAIKNLSSLSTKDIDKLVSGLLGGNASAQSLFNKLGPKCSTKGLSTGKLGKPYDANIDCNGKKRKGNSKGCTSSEYSNVLNKLTNGRYEATSKDLNSALQNLVALSKYGYDVNLCGVFTELSTGLGKNLLSRASGALLGHLGLTSNPLGVFDLAGASAGLHSLIENPGAITGVFKNFKIPSEIPGKDLSGFCDRLTGSMTLIKDDWNKSAYDGMISTSFSSEFNSSVDTVFKAKQTGNSFSITNLNTPIIGDDTFLATAYSMGSANVNSGLLGSLFG